MQNYTEKEALFSVKMHKESLCSLAILPRTKVPTNQQTPICDKKLNFQKTFYEAFARDYEVLHLTLRSTALSRNPLMVF